MAYILLWTVLLLSSPTSVVLAAVNFTNSDYSGIKVGSPFDITWAGDGTGATITVLNGPVTNLQPVRVLTTGNTDSSYLWTPQDFISAGSYALSIAQSGVVNYSPKFNISTLIAHVPAKSPQMTLRLSIKEVVSIPLLTGTIVGTIIAASGSVIVLATGAPTGAVESVAPVAVPSLGEAVNFIDAGQTVLGSITLIEGTIIALQTSMIPTSADSSVPLLSGTAATATSSPSFNTSAFSAPALPSVSISIYTGTGSNGTYCGGRRNGTALAFGTSAVTCTNRVLGIVVSTTERLMANGTECVTPFLAGGLSIQTLEPGATKSATPFIGLGDGAGGTGGTSGASCGGMGMWTRMRVGRVKGGDGIGPVMGGIATIVIVLGLAVGGFVMG